jgi:cytoskeleton protein RodZ
MVTINLSTLQGELWVIGFPVPMKSVGTQLREARESRGWTIKAASKQTKIREDQILRLEADDFSKLHAPTYVRGFVRNYSSSLGLNAAKILAELERVLEMEGGDSYLSLGVINYVPELTKPKRELTPRTFFLGIAALLLVSIIAIVFVQTVRLGPLLVGQETPAAASNITPENPPGTTNVTLAPLDAVIVKKAEPVIARAVLEESIENTAASIPPNSLNKLVLRALDDGWVRVTAIENEKRKEVFADVISKGSQVEFSAPKFQVKFRDPSLIEYSLNGKAFDTYSKERSLVEIMLPAGG